MSTETNALSFPERLALGKEFECFARELIAFSLRWHLTPVDTFTLQKRGLCDTFEGVEFKFARTIHKSIGSSKRAGLFFVEVGQKKHVTQKQYRHSSLWRKDNSWLWCVGDFSKIYIVPKKYLIFESQRSETVFEENQAKTGLGFWLPRSRLETLSAKVVEPPLETTENYHPEIKLVPPGEKDGKPTDTIEQSCHG